MPGNVQIQRKVPLTDTKISKETKTKIALYNLLQKYYAIISKCYNDMGQTYLIERHIATRPNAAPVAAQPYPLILNTMIS